MVAVHPRVDDTDHASFTGRRTGVDLAILVMVPHVGGFHTGHTVGYDLVGRVAGRILFDEQDIGVAAHLGQARGRQGEGDGVQFVELVVDLSAHSRGNWVTVSFCPGLNPTMTRCTLTSWAWPPEGRAKANNDSKMTGMMSALMMVFTGRYLHV